MDHHPHAKHHPADGGHDHNHSHDHDHSHGHDDAGALRFSIALLTVTLAMEIVGGWMTGSLALLADAGHVFMDLFALAISLMASVLSRRPATFTRTYGWHRAEILAALINGVLLTVLSAGLLHEAWGRFHNPTPVLAIPMLVVAAIGLLANVIIAWRLHRPHHVDLNMRSAYLHVLGDTLASVGVLTAGAVIYFTGSTLADVVISVIIGLLILAGAVSLIVKAAHILLEGVPTGLSVHAVAEAIRKVDGVRDVHDIHIWTLCSHIVNLSCHINLEWKNAEHHDRMVKTVAEMLQHRFSIVHATIQVDYVNCDDQIIGQDMKHRH